MMESLSTGFKSSTFFKPDSEFLDWIIQLIDNRMVFDIGCGNGHFLKELKRKDYHRIVGIDAHSDYYAFRNEVMEEFGAGNPIQFIPDGIESSMAQNLIKGASKNVPVVCFLNRPCHGFVLVSQAYQLCKENNIELIYIGLESNIDIDLDSMGIPYEILKHKGSSSDDEIVLKLG